MMDAALAALRVAVPMPSRPNGSTATTTTPSRRPTAGRRCGSPARVRSGRARSDIGRHPGIDGRIVVHRARHGQRASYQSSSHGAGRRLGRKAAFRQLSTESLRTAMAGRAWDESLAEQLVDEHPDAYKPIPQVMADQADLVEVVHELHQVVNLKGA